MSVHHSNNYSKHYTYFNSVSEIFLAASNDIQCQTLKNTWFFFFFFFMLKVVICLVARWFLAASISFFWPCPHSCKISLPASSSMFRLKISKRKKRMVPAISVPFYQGSQSFSRCFNRFLLLSPLLVLSPSTPSCIED